MVDKTGERFYEAELYRLKGELTLQSKSSSIKFEDSSKQVQDKSSKPKSQHPNPELPSRSRSVFSQSH